jgi:hypothetical protein
MVTASTSYECFIIREPEATGVVVPTVHHHPLGGVSLESFVGSEPCATTLLLQGLQQRPVDTQPRHGHRVL